MRRAFLFLSLATLAPAAPVEFASPASHTPLLELFTSEGCSSCPPAEKWLGALRDHPRLWQDFVPVAWHVDYWDRLGWKDRFASREATQRQYAYAETWRSGSVYTPCLVLDAKEHHARVAPVAGSEQAGTLRAAYEAGKLTVTFDPRRAGEFTAHAVLLAMNVTSKVTRGENQGRSLRHDFVALGPARSAPLRDARAELRLPPPAETSISELAIAVWITRQGELTPIQAAGTRLAQLARATPADSTPH